MNSSARRVISLKMVGLGSGFSKVLPVKGAFRNAKKINKNMGQNKKILIAVISLIIIGIGGYFVYTRYFKKKAEQAPTFKEPTAKEITKKDILNSLTAPTDKTNFTKQDIETLNNLSAPENPKPTNTMTDQERQKILQSLTAPVK